MPQDYAASIAGTAIRVARLNSDGSPASGSAAAYLMTSFISVSFTPEYEEGDEITQKDANGVVCVAYKAPDTLKRVALEVAICNPDPEFTELVAGGTILATGGNTVGYAAPEAGVEANPNGAALDVWSRAVKGGKNASINPYYRWVFPYVVLRPSGDRVIENGLMAQTFEGWGLGNIEYGTGPSDDWAFPEVTDRPYAYARVATSPSGNGYQTVA